MSFVAVAIGGAALIGAGATAYASKSASDSAADANKQNRKIADATNQLNYRMFLESRGSGGHALLPLYFPEGTEEALANRAMGLVRASQDAYGTPEQQLAAYQAIVDSLSPSMQAGDALVNDLFSGALEERQVGNLRPVMEARGKVAGAQKQGIMEALSERLNALRADRARAGYSGGGSSMQRNLLRSATLPALQQAATVGAQADLLNATDEANVRNAAIQTRLENLSLPLTQAANRVQLRNLPATAAGAATQAMFSPLDWFKLTPQAFQANQGPLVTPVPNTGQIVGAGVSAAASSLGNYYANKALVQQLSPSTTSRSFTVDDYFNAYGPSGYSGTQPTLLDAGAGYGNLYSNWG